MSSPTTSAQWSSSVPYAFPAGRPSSAPTAPSASDNGTGSSPAYLMFASRRLLDAAGVDAQHAVNGDAARHGVRSNGDQRLARVEMRDEGDGALIVELTEHVVEQENRRAAGQVGAHAVTAESERQRERPLFPLGRVS